MEVKARTYQSDIEGVLCSSVATNELQRLDTFYSGRNFLSLHFQEGVNPASGEGSVNSLVYAREGFADGKYVGTDKCISCFRQMTGNSQQRLAFTCGDRACINHVSWFAVLPDDLQQMQNKLLGDLRRVDRDWDEQSILDR